jgi:hypothetical protein
MPEALPLVPMPRELVRGDGHFAPNGRAWRAHPHSLGRPAIAHKMAQLAAELQGDGSLPAFSVRVGEPRTLAAAPHHRAGYGLVIDAGGIDLRGADADGLFWGLVTCERLLDGGKTLPQLAIRDWPECAIRYHHDDVSRKQVSRLPDFKRIVRLLSSFKISHYSLYLEDMLHLKSFPDIGEGRGKLMPDEVAAIVREGELHNVEVFPTFQLIGHQENLLAKEKYAHLGRKVFQPMSSLDPAKPEVRQFLEKAIDDVCALFPSKLFHMGFDETQGVDADLFLAHANWCAEQLVKRGKTPVMWVDMIYNHFGYDKVRDLHPAIQPCNWEYGCRALPIKHQAQLEAQGRPVWALAGYSTWCCFLPDSEASKDHLATWPKHFAGKEGAALGSSQWGDDGYENSRDLPWHLFAFFAESAWSGPEAERASFDARFQRSFYGAELPEVARVLAEVPRKLADGPGHYWRVHRRPITAMMRAAAADPAAEAKAASDERVLDEALAAVEKSRPLARREADHLDHLVVALERTRSVARRRRLAHKLIASPPTKRELNAAASELERVRDRYREVWLRHNKPENIEVSLGVFDRVIGSLRELAAPEEPSDAGRWLPLDLGARFDTRALDLAGMPINEATIGGVTFRFAGVDRTHVAMKAANQPLRLEFAPTRARDLHLVASAPKPGDERPAPALRVELQRGGKTVFAEDLQLITHLCDWWAPLGEHMWAGGGYAYVDRARVGYLFSPTYPYGLCDVHGFALRDGIEADALVLTPLIATDLALFAATIERG